MGGSGRNALAGREGRTVGKPQKSRYGPPIPDHLLQRAAGRSSIPPARPAGLPSPPTENKQRAVRFIDSITAEGGTDHEEALKLAIRLQPDVIFFLTDADDPKLTPAQLEKIRRLAAGIIINAIEFGPGPKPAGASFLAELARQNGGGYAYVDLSQRK